MLLSTGVETPRLTRPLGFAPAIYPVKGYSGTWEIRDPARIPHLPFVDETELLAVTQYDGHLRVTAIAEFAGRSDFTLPECRIALLRDYVARNFNDAVAADSATFWAGQRPSTAAGPPYLGRARRMDNLWVNAGHGQLGWTMAAACGELVASAMSGQKTAWSGYPPPRVGSTRSRSTMMTSPRLITYNEGAPYLTWPDAVAALRSGHKHPAAQVADMFLGPDNRSLLSRGAFIEGLGFGVKSVTVFGENPVEGLPSVQGAMLMFEPEHGALAAIIESKLVTEIKTAADSVLGATLLARPDSRTLLIIGAGAVARSLIEAYTAIFPAIERIMIWARRIEQAEVLAQDINIAGVDIFPVSDLGRAAGDADIISTATMAREPVLSGSWVKPGTHVDLIGAFKSDMREADDALISGGTLFVDSRETTLHHIGELMIPIAAGVITPDAVKGDLYGLIGGTVGGRNSPDEITIFKNGGGAHLDLMIADYIARMTQVGTDT